MGNKGDVSESFTGLLVSIELTLATMRTACEINVGSHIAYA